MKKHIWTYGLIGGAIMSLMLALSLPFIDRIGFEHGALLGYTSMVLAFLTIYFGVRSYRDQVAGGSIGFGRSLLVGFLIMLVASSCYVATWQVVYRGFMPDFDEKFIRYQLDQSRQAGASAAELAQAEQELTAFFEMYQNPWVSSAITFLEPLPVGLFFVFGSAFVLSRRRAGSSTAGPG